MKLISFPRRLLARALTLLAAGGFLSAIVPAAAQVQCIETNGTKFLLPPQIDGGWDVRDDHFVMLADDFFCNTAGPITDIHLWGSWLNDLHGQVTNFWLGIYDDVPAATNFLTGEITPSHPGTNLLWQQSFVPGQYAELVYSNGSESFFDPSVTNIIGSDTTAWYYCFYPTNPFVQQGTATAPTNYWLAVWAEDIGNGRLFGWKTAQGDYNDAAVWRKVNGGLPVGNWTPMYNFSQQPINLAFKLTTPTNPPPGCVETNGVKFLLPPKIDGGWDVQDSRGIVVADDFSCTTTGPITDIHIWGSWLSNSITPITNFWLGIYNDVPAATNLPTGTITPSHPGTNLLWQQSFGPGQFAQTIYGTGIESFFDPSTTNIIGSDSQAWYYCFYPTKPFVQQGTAAAPTNYWLVVYAQLSISNQSDLYGWKTSLGTYNDAAVWGNWASVLDQPLGNWKPMYDFNEQPINLAFKLTTPTNAPPPQGCIETNGVKYVQWPNLFGGLDVWNSGPWVLADDFICTNSGPVTDIHLWGSWLTNGVSANLTFTLAIYDDVPVSISNNFSHPGDLQWQETFLPGQYVQSFWSSSDELFLDPGGPAIIGPDTQAWYFCFYPTNVFVQKGGAAAPKTYWLMVYAQPPAGETVNYGWKTTTNLQHDVSVFAPWPGLPPPNPWPWAPTHDTTGLPLDLAFKITTDTNQCKTTVVCATNKTVECGSSWSFDPPMIVPNPCCTNLPTVNFSAFTNGLGPCQEIITGIWVIQDCVGAAITCTQVVTVVDTTPPVVTCPTNKKVECGTAWAFDTPTAVDACCGTNVTVAVTSTVTNSGPCPLVVVRAWTITDCCSNSVNCSQTVTVVDTTPPSIVCPSNIVVKTCGTNSVVVNWSLSATDTCSGVIVTSTPPSGTAFAPNTTNTVVATATDGCGNTNTCSFTVTVTRPVLTPIAIRYVHTNLVVVLNWTDGILQTATNVMGPYVDVPGATPPFTNTATLPMKFFRLRCSSP